MARFWPFTFPAKMSPKDMEVRDLFDLIARGTAEGILEAERMKNSVGVGTTADAVKAGLDHKRQLMNG